MATATIGELKAAAIRAGVPDGEPANIAAAIAMAESGGVIDVHNDDPSTGDDSYGPWQINRLAHPQYSPAELTTLDGNARAMAAISRNGTKWTDWTTYNKGRHLAFLPTARATPAATTTGAGTITPVLDPGDLFGVTPFGEWLAGLFGVDDVGVRVLVAGLTLMLAAAGLALAGLGLATMTNQRPDQRLQLAAQVAGVAAV